MASELVGKKERKKHKLWCPGSQIIKTFHERRVQPDQAGCGTQSDHTVEFEMFR